MSYIQTATNEIELDEDEIELETSTNGLRKKDSKRLIFGGVLTACCLVLSIVTVIMVICFQSHNSHFNSNKPVNSDDLVNAIMEDPSQCLMDENCTSFTYNDAEMSRINQIFNEYDGDNDDLWAKEEFIKFYIDSFEGGGEYDPFASMDLNNDGVWSYKEAVIYFMMFNELSSVKDVIYPLFQNVIADIYHYNTTHYQDQLFWEYVAELMFVEFDDYQQGFVTKANYLARVAELEFDVFAKNDANHETITFDEFLDSRFSQQSLDNFVNTDINALFLEYQHLDSLTNNNSNIDHLLSGLQLKHCLYSDTDFEMIRRRLASTKWDCIMAVVGCTSVATATVAACVTAATGVTTPVSIIYCVTGVGGTTASCYSAKQTCQAWLDGL